MELFTRENIGNYTSDPYAKNDHKYSKKMQEIRKELRKLDKKIMHKEELLIGIICLMT